MKYAKKNIQYIIIISAVLLSSGCIFQRTESFIGGNEGIHPWKTDGKSTRDFSDRDIVGLDKFSPSGLEDYINYGLSQNSELRAAEARYRAALEQVPQAKSLPDPRFSFTHFIEELETRTGPQRNRFAFMQSFPWFEKLSLRSQAAFKKAVALFWKTKAVQFKVKRDIKRLFYEYAYLAREIEITRENIELLKQLEPVVQRQLKTGGRQDDLLKLQIEIGKLENDLASLYDLKPAVSTKLRGVLNAPQGDVYPFPEPFEPEIRSLSKDVLEAIIKERNPDLKSLSQSMAQREKEIDLARKGPLPDLTLGFQYFETGSSAMPGTRGSGDDPFAITASFNIPLWWGKYSAAKREAESLRNAAEHDFHSKKNSLDSEFAYLFFQARKGEREIALYGNDLIPRASQSLRVILKSYTAGQSSILDVIDRHRTLLAFKQKFQRSASDYEIRIAEIEALCGGGIK